MSTPTNPRTPQPPPVRSRYWRPFAAFQYPDFRVLWASTITNQIGQGMQQVLLGFLVFQITDSASMVGAAFAARSAPFLLVGFMVGSITDRLDRRFLMRSAVTGMLSVSLVLGTLALVGSLQVWHLIALAFFFGIFQSFYMTARQVYAYDIVGTAGAINGIALISLAQRIGGVIGALTGGLTLQWQGPETAFFVMAGGYSIGLTALFGLRRIGQSAPVERESMKDNIVSYFRALKSNRAMSSLMVSTAGSEMLGFSHQVMLPILAEDVLEVGPAGLGILTAFRFIGGAMGIITLGAFSWIRHRGLLLLGALSLFGLGVVLLSQSPNFWVALLFVTFVNSMASTADILHQTLLQTCVPNDQRGRSMGSWIVGVGTAPVGHMEVGYVAGATSAPFALLINGIGLAILPLLLLVFFPQFRQMR